MLLFSASHMSAVPPGSRASSPILGMCQKNCVDSWGLSLRLAPLYGHSSCGSTTLANENLALWRHFPRISDLRFKGTHPGGSFHGPFSPSAMYILSELHRSQNRAPAWYGNGRSTMAHFMEYSLLVFFNCQILDDSAVPSFSPFSCLMSRLCSPYLSLKVLEVSPK